MGWGSDSGGPGNGVWVIRPWGWERPGVGAEPQTLGSEPGGGWRRRRLRFREVGAGGWVPGSGRWLGCRI